MIETSIQSEYREILHHTSGMDPLRWYGEWHKAYIHTRARNLPEIQGQLAIQDFLVAASKFSLNWANRQLEDLSLKARESQSLEQIAHTFAAQQQQKITINRAAPGIFAFRNQGSDALRSIQYVCPYQKQPSDPHPSNPTQYEKLHKGIRDCDKRICKLLKKERYFDLHAKLQANRTYIPTGDESTRSL